MSLEVAAQGKKGTVTEITLGVGGLRHIEIWGYKPNRTLLKKQLLCQGAAGWQNSHFSAMDTEKSEILKREMSLNIVSDSIVQE